MSININIKGTAIDLTPSIRDYVEEKVNSLEKLVDSRDSGLQADVEVGRTTKHHASGDIFRAEINFTSQGALYRAESEKDDLYAAIDDTKNELMRQLRKRKTKRKDVARRSGLHFKKLMRKLSRTEDENDET